MTEQNRIATNMRTLLILEAIGRLGDAVTPAALGREIGLSKQTVHRLCNTLVEEGFLARAPHQKGLRPGRRMRTMATGILQATSLHVARHQVLLQLAAKVRETVNFVVPEDRGMKYQDRVETDWPFRIHLPVGTNVPFHCTASGKTYLASLPKAERTRLVHVMNLERMTANTIVDPVTLLEELATIAKAGYALDNEEFVDGMVAIAVPVRDPLGRYAASLAFHGPIQRISQEAALAKKQIMFETAQQLSQVLFGTDDA